MRIVVAGALGEVGGTVSAALESLGHVVLPVSSRAGRDEVSAIGLGAAVEHVRCGCVDAVLSAAGRGDRRMSERTGQESTPALAHAAELTGIPAVLLSTTRVLEGLSGDIEEDAHAACSTPYAQANADNEAAWLEAAPTYGSIVRITNYFCEPKLADSPQSLLLPWSLVIEAVRTEAVEVRSAASTSRDFVSADDVARAVLAVAESPASVRVCATAPSLTVSLADLAECTAAALADAGMPRPTISFGRVVGPVSTFRPGWLRQHGWSSSLSLDEMQRAITSWLSRVDLD